MNHVVVWLAAAEQSLIDQYLLARQYGDAALIAPAVARIDRQLEANPGGCGESRDGTRRVVYDHPVTIEFEVFADQRVVVVTRVRYRRPRPR